MADEQNQSNQNQNTQSGASTKQAREDNFSGGSANSGDKNTGAASVTDSVTETAKGLYDQAKDTAGQAYGTATEKAKSTIEEQKTNLATSLTSVADSIKQVGENLRGADDQIGIANFTAKYSDSLAQQIEQISDYFENQDLRQMARDLEGFARRNPAIFIGGAFALGIFAARFLKSSSTTQTSNRGSRGSRYGRSPGRNADNQSNRGRNLNSGTGNNLDESTNTPDQI